MDKSTKYRQDLTGKLQAAQKRVKQGREVKALKESAPTLFEIIDTEISMEVNRGYGEKALSYEDYLESHGAVRGIKRIRNLLDSKEAEAVSSNEEVTILQKQLKTFDDEQKQK